MDNVTFEDNHIEVIRTIDDCINIVLKECAEEFEARVKRNTRVDTGKTKASWKNELDEENHIAYIGSDYENAIWEEFGTGEYALEGNGRQGGWRYQDPSGEWHFTRGKKPSRAMYNAYIALKDKIVDHIKQALEGLDNG